MEHSPILYEGVVSVLSSITHNGGQSFGINQKLRREKLMLPDGRVDEIVVISGNAMRGLLRDLGMYHMCRVLGYGEADTTGKPRGLSLAAFHLLFSGGSLGGKTTRGIDIDFARSLRTTIPLLSVFGTASGNQMLDGRVNIGKMIPICQESAHIIPPLWIWHSSRAFRQQIRATFGADTTPEQFTAIWCALLGKPHPITADVPTDSDERLSLYEQCSAVLPSIWDLTQEEMFTRKDDEKRDDLRQLIAADTRMLLDVERQAKAAKGADAAQDDTGKHQQMMYYTETIIAGSSLYWEITLRQSLTDIEFEAFWSAMGCFGHLPFIGGKSGTGHGKVAIRFKDWLSVDSRANVSGIAGVDVPLGSRYMAHLQTHADDIQRLLAGIG